MADIIVVGCGVIGLSTAIRLAEAGHRVHLLARERSPHTTSDIAAAVWYPFHAGPRERALEWSRTSFGVLRDFAGVPDAGVTMVEGIELFRTGVPEQPWWSAAVEAVRPARRDELPPGYAGGHVFAAPVAQMPVYLRWLEARVQALGATIERREIDNLAALLEEAEVVVNCTGLGAALLLPDSELYPVRGQVVRVAPGHADRFIQDTGDPGAITYVIPRPDCTILGGTAEVGVWDLTPDPATAEVIRARCIALEPALARAEVLSHAVGLRPGRSQVRLEAEPREQGLVVHNYGHGGAGVTLSWGCADDVVRLIALSQDR